MKNVLKNLIVGVLIVASASVFAAPVIWDGTADTTWFTGNSGSYEINTAEQLAGLAKMVNEGTVDFEPITITLGSDIFLNDTSGATNGTWNNNPLRNWIPIGKKGHPFMGKFNGSAGERNHKIYGLYINSTSDSVGLFGYTNKARITNLDILVGKISANKYVGSLVGYALGGHVANVHAEIDIVKGQSYVGGLAGYSTGMILSSSTKAMIHGGNYVGGIVGYAKEKIDSSFHVGGNISGAGYVGGLVGRTYAFVSNSYSEGNVTGTKAYIGGLIGCGVDVSNSYANGMVKGDSNYVGGVAGKLGTIDSSYHIGGNVNGAGYVGGLVGLIDSSVVNSYSEGNVNGTNAYVGGLIGYGVNVSNSYANGAVKGDSNYVGGIAGKIGTIDSSYHIGGNVNGAGYVGGLAGYADSSVMNSYSEGDVTGLKNYVGGLIGMRSYYYKGSADKTTISFANSHAIGNIKGNDYVGGLIGLDSIYRDVKNSNRIERIIRDSHSKGAVNGRGFVGGLVGKSSHGAVESAYNKNFVGQIISSYHYEGDVSGTSNYVGGIAGSVYGAVDSSYHTDGYVSGGGYVGGLIGYTDSSVTNSHSRGNVVGQKAYVGGLIGYGKSISQCFVDGSVNGEFDYVGGIVGYTTGIIDSSYHEGGDISGAGYVGGLTGYTNASIAKSFSIGAVMGTGNYVGGLIGYAYYSANKSVSVLDNSYSVGDIRGDNYVGGLIGLDSIKATNSSIYIERSVRNSHSQGNIEGNMYVGGVVGKSCRGSDYFSMTYIAGQIISSSHSEGDVIGSSNYVGGITGYFYGTIDSSYHAGGNVSGNSYVGGLAGLVDSTVSNSYSKGNVIGMGDYVGGLVGNAYYRYTASEAGLITILSNSYAVGDIKGRNFVGGLIGLDSICRDVNNLNRIERIIRDSHSQGMVNGKSYVGGLIGKSSHGATTPRYNRYFAGQIVSSYHSEGDVFGESSYVGGIAGYSYGTLDSCYSNSNVTGSGDYVGGLAGLSLYLYRDSSEAINTLSNSYSVGNIKGGKYVGGLIGLDSIYRDVNNLNRIERIIRDSHSQGMVDGKSYVGGLIGKSSHGAAESGYNGKFFGQIVSCHHSEGDVIGISDYVGGVAGSFYGVVDSSFHMGGSVNGAGYVGGLAGMTDSIANSYSKGNVFGTKPYVGGLVGRGAKVSKGYAAGSVKGNADYVGGIAGHVGRIDSSYHIGGNVIGSGYVGGLAGSAGDLVTNSYSIGDVSGTSYVGGLAGYSCSTCSIADSYSEGNVIGTKTRVGGLVGCGGDISKSYAKGTVKGDSSYVGGVAGYATGIIDSSYHIGGDIIGESYVGGLAGKTGSVDGSYSEGNVIGVNLYVGGLAGYSGSISKSYAKGSVKGDSSYVGGVVGYATGIIDSSYHIGGDIIGESYVGGLAGKTGSVDGSYSKGSVMGTRNCVGGLVGVASNSITNSYSEALTVKGVDSIGGLVGFIMYDKVISLSFFVGDSVIGVSHVGGLVGTARGSVDSSYSIGHVKGEKNLGGLVGSVRGNISNSYAAGNVAGDAERSSADNDNLGGLVGYQYSGFISKSMALGNVVGSTKLGGLVGRFEGTSISQSYAKGDIGGKYYIGGIVGYGQGEIEEVYASGNVSGFEMNPVYTGCIVGYVNGSLSVKKTYYDKTRCNLGIDGGENAVSLIGNPAKTTEEMQTQSTYIDWDFANVWKIESNTYPFLRMYAKSLVNADVLTESLGEFEYDGQPKTPRVTTVTFFDEVLTENVDYVVDYEKNVDAGTAKIGVCGLNLYDGCKNIRFEIAPKAIQPTISAIEDVVYTGLAITPNISVYNGETLLEASDYTAEYSDNVNVGTASVAITMKGNYSGTAIKTFTIGKANPVISQNPSASDITVGSTLALSNLANGSANVPGSFAWKDPEIIPTLENTGYEVVFTPNDEVNYNSVEMTVPVKVWDIAYVAVHIGERTLDSVVVVKGANYTLPIVPDSIGYDFAGFFQGNSAIGGSGDVISVNENTVLDAKYSVKIFAVNFVNGTIELQLDNLPYGSLPKYTGNIPVKTSTAKYTYTFNGWNPAIETVSKSATYTAVFDSVVNKYEITFVNGNTVLQSSEVEYGTLPTPPTVSLPENTAQYTYSFGGWDRDVVAVTGATTYSAIINQTVNKYSVVFKDYNGTILKNSVKYNYGTFAADIVKPANPIRSSSAQYAYTFKGWSPTISEVTKDAEYVAEYDSTLRNYTIAFVSESETLQSTNVDYGVVPTYDGAAPIKAASAKYTYTFKGWSPAVSNVIGDAVYTALYDSTLRTYAIAFVNGSETLQSSEFGYGTIPSYKGTVPTKKETKEYTYTFKGWNPTITAVTGKATYKALFDSTLQKYTVVFKNGNDKLQTISVAYGETPKYTGKTPTKKSTNDYSYEFVGWSPKLGPITKETEFVAVFDSTKVTGIQNALRVSSNMSVNIVSMNIQISAAPIGKTYALIDMQGRILQKGNVESANFNIIAPSVGFYFIRIDNQIRKVNVR